MTDVHPTAIILGDVDLAADVTVGPGCVVDGTKGPVTVGPRTRLIGSVYLYGPLTMGENNTVYPFACLGFAPQSLTLDDAHAGRGLSIGDHNTFREGATVHRAMTDAGPTTVGDHNFFMCNTHAGHDARVGNHCVLANGALLGGHVIVDDWVTVGGNTGVHQFCRLGRGAMLSGSVATTYDVAPFFMLTGISVVGSLNVVGMRRRGLPKDEIEDIRWVYKTLYRRELSKGAALEAIKERADRPVVAEYIEFIETSERGLCRGHLQPQRVQEH